MKRRAHRTTGPPWLSIHQRRAWHRLGSIGALVAILTHLAMPGAVIHSAGGLHRRARPCRLAYFVSFVSFVSAQDVCARRPLERDGRG